MSEDISERLRKMPVRVQLSGSWERDCYEAADEMARLRGEVERLTRERDDAKTDAEEWQDKYNDEHKTADELSIKLEGARTDWSLQSKISNGYAGALIIAEKARDAALARAEAAEAKVAKLREALKPFAEALEGNFAEQEEDHVDLWESPAASVVTYGDLRRARTALQETEQ